MEDHYVLYLLILASLRVYLEIISFDFSRLPLTALIQKRYGQSHVLGIHRMGLIFSIGYIILFAPEYLLS